MFDILIGSSNEGQFAFNVESIVMAQKLRGTLTYVIKVHFVPLYYFRLFLCRGVREGGRSERVVPCRVPLVEFGFKL